MFKKCRNCGKKSWEQFKVHVKKGQGKINANAKVKEIDRKYWKENKQGFKLVDWCKVCRICSAYILMQSWFYGIQSDFKCVHTSSVCDATNMIVINTNWEYLQLNIVHTPHEQRGEHHCLFFFSRKYRTLQIDFLSH